MGLLTILDSAEHRLLDRAVQLIKTFYLKVVRTVTIHVER
jgi:hypothetical protein